MDRRRFLFARSCIAREGLRLAFVAVSLMALVLSEAACCAADMKFSPSDLQIMLDAGAPGGQASMVLDVSGAGDAKITEPKDLGVPNPPPLDVTFSATELPSGGDPRHLLLTATVRGLTDVVTQKRFLSFNLGPQSVTLPYTLSNRPTKDFAWSVRVPTTEISLRPGQAIEIGVSVGPVPATGVALSQASFVEQTIKTVVGDGWELCEALPQCVDQTFSIPANSQKRLWLRPKGGAEVVGKYSGTLVIGAAQKREGEAVTMSISGTSFCVQVLGAATILLGVVFAWTATGYLQTRLNRAQLLQPVAALIEQIGETTKRLDRSPDSLKRQTPQTTAALIALTQSLSERTLQVNGFLPGQIPNPFAAWTLDADKYKTYIAQRTQKLGWLDLLVTQGFEKLWQKLPPVPADIDLNKARQVSAALDALSSKDAPPQPDPLIDIRRELDAFPTPAPPLGPAMNALPVHGAGGATPLSYQGLTVEVANASLLTWALFAVLATALGTYVVVLSNTGFGLAADFLVCFFWGVGVPIGAQQLSQQTTVSAGSALGVMVPAARK